MIEVGLIGFGLAGKCFHAPVIRAVPGLRLAAIVQRSGDEAARKISGCANCAQRGRTAGASKRFALIVIATPNQTHFPFAKQCLEAGRDVVVDKPFANSVAEAVELFRIASKRQRLLTVYHNRRFDADFQAIACVCCQRCTRPNRAV